MDEDTIIVGSHQEVEEGKLAYQRAVQVRVAYSENSCRAPTAVTQMTPRLPNFFVDALRNTLCLGAHSCIDFPVFLVIFSYDARYAE